MRGKIYLVPVVALLLILPPGLSSAQGIEREEMEKINSIAASFFDALVEGETEGALDKIAPYFPIDNATRDFFLEQLDALMKRAGKPDGWDAVSQRSIPGTDKYYLFYFLTYHVVKPAAWEIAFYKRGDKWIVNNLRFNTKNIYEFLNMSELEYNFYTGDR